MHLSLEAHAGGRPGLLLELANLVLTLHLTLAQQVSEPELRDDPDYRTKVGGGCDDGLLESLESVVSDIANDICDPTRTCCRDWADANGEPGQGSAKACTAHSTEAACEQSLGCNWVAPPSSFFGDSLPGSCKPDLTQMCCACDNVSPDGNCPWTSLCFKCTGTVAENGCPEACAFDIFKWRTGIDPLDETMLAIPPGCGDALDVATHLGCQQVPRFQVAIAVVLIYLILGCSVAPPLFWPCKICKCCCKCMPGVGSLCEEAYSSPDSASSDDEETRRERRRRRKQQELRLKKKKKKTTTTTTTTTTKEKAGVGGHRPNSTARSGVDRYRVVEKAMLKSDCELDSDIVGSLAEGTVIRCREARTNSTGQLRVRCSKGWASTVAKDGSLLLEKIQGSVVPQDSGNASSRATAAGAAVDEMRTAADSQSTSGSRRTTHLPAQTDWQERFSDEHNRKYWVNRTTGKSSWVEPEQQAQHTPPARRQERTPTADSGSAWDKLFSEQHNRHYWSNSSTGERTWTDPTTSSVQNPTRLSRASTVEVEV
eukprot:COSAG02_NODE_2808_length_7981_cov_8.763385_3_plen_541_part_00